MERAQPTSAAEPQQLPSTVLVVMEDLFFRKLLRRHLEAVGYSVLEALSVERAMVRVRAESPDVVLLDTWVDRGSGLRLVEALREEPAVSGLPVVLMGDDTRENVRQRGAELGVGAPLPLSEWSDVGFLIEDALLNRA
jgi:PleD family two-component response regulator